jgi:hypothetical protein
MLTLQIVPLIKQLRNSCGAKDFIQERYETEQNLAKTIDIESPK